MRFYRLKFKKHRQGWTFGSPVAVRAGLQIKLELSAVRPIGQGMASKARQGSILAARLSITKQNIDITTSLSHQNRPEHMAHGTPVASGHVLFLRPGVPNWLTSLLTRPLLSSVPCPKLWPTTCRPGAGYAWLRFLPWQLCALAVIARAQASPCGPHRTDAMLRVLEQITTFLRHFLVFSKDARPNGSPSL